MDSVNRLGGWILKFYGRKTGKRFKALNHGQFVKVGIDA
jgi:hypothetical protein